MSMAAGVTLERLASLTSADLPLIRIILTLMLKFLRALLAFVPMIRCLRTFW